MIVLLLSPAALSHDTAESRLIDGALGRLASSEVIVCVVSNHPKPAWFDARFADTQVEYLQAPGRQSGQIVRDIAEHLKVTTSDVLVLAVNGDDLQMGTNGRAVVLSAQWVRGNQVGHLGIGVATPHELEQIVALSSGWFGGWWYEGDGDGYRVRALADLSSKGRSETQQEFAGRLTRVVKNGGAKLSALLTVTARSLLSVLSPDDSPLFGVYPSSASDNGDSEILSDFTHRLRTAVTRVHFAERGSPLFIRHKPSIQRHGGGSGDRTDPSNQVNTIHVNPVYRSRLRGRHVIVVDDCVTYGVSFGVAAAMLKAGGATSVTGVALGKFGSCTREYLLKLRGRQFGPVKLVEHSSLEFRERTSPVAQELLRTLLEP